jgi:hypothetical protein
MSNIDCPRARTGMTPCIARDGRLALSDHDDIRPLTCVGCSADPCRLLLDLSERYVPARRYRQTHAPMNCADTLARLVEEYVNQ